MLTTILDRHGKAYQKTLYFKVDNLIVHGSLETYEKYSVTHALTHFRLLGSNNLKKAKAAAKAFDHAMRWESLDRENYAVWSKRRRHIYNKIMKGLGLR